LPDDPLLIDEEERAPRGGLTALGEHAVAADDLQFRKVAEERVGQLEGIREGLLREGVAGADAEDLDVQVLELAVVGLPG